MCGIAGIVHLDGSPVLPGELNRMTDAISHRGPDGRGTYSKDNVGLGHRRLSILDLSDAASQPMESKEKRYVLVFNGEIYNFQEQKKLLEEKGHHFHSTGDTEVLLALYMEYGPECVHKLRGMFAFAVLDRQRNSLFIARDRVGKKPVVYFQHGNTFAFASEIKALKTLPECPREIDEEAIHHFLTVTYLPAPLTGFKGIEKLPAAHTLLLDLNTNKIDIQRYWSLKYETNHKKSLAQWQEEILSSLEESVRLRMIADVPVGAFLSGGIDSAAVVAFMSKQSSHPVQTFSIGSSDPTSELPDAERIAKAFGTDHHPIMLEPNIVELLPELVRTYEQPFGDPSVIPTYLVSRETRKNVTVALSGDGGDENFAGYLRYPILLFSERWRRVPLVHGLASAATRFLARKRPSTFTYRSQIFEESLSLPWERRVLRYFGGFTDEEKALVEPNIQKYLVSDAWFMQKTIEARLRADGILHQAMSADFDTYLADDLMPKVDLGAMAHSLEVRSPFLDHEFLELTAQIPAKYMLKGRQTKWILKQALRKILPAETLHKKKQGFRLPLDSWFRGDLRDFVEDRLYSGNPLFYSLFDQSGIGKLLERYYSTQIDLSPQIWMLLWLQEWCEQNG